jgi:two-component system sensor histidine kinase UhpB
VSADAQRIAISVRDDGVGLAEDWARAGHFGLRGLAERVAQLGGRFSVANGAAGGVELGAEFPLGVAA